MSIFNMESSFMRALTRVADLMILNFITLICCIPVITAGAALTALHYMCLKMVREEEGYLLKGYFKAFRENLKQATLLWLLLLLAVGVIVTDVAVMYYAVIDFPFIIRIAILVVGFIVLCTSMYLFPMQAKFANSIPQTIKNAFMASMIQFPKTLLMVLMLFVPPGVILLSERFVPLVLVFFFSLHAYLSALLYNKFFLRMEDRNPVRRPVGAQGEDGRIFHDELEASRTEDNTRRVP